MANKAKSPAEEAGVAPAGVLTPEADTSTTAPTAPTAAPVADPGVETDSTDEAAAGSWDDLEDAPVAIDGSRLTDMPPIHAPRRMKVTYKPGIYLRIGPGKQFAHERVLAAGTAVYEAYVPDYAKVPGWLCVSVESDDGSPLYGWVDETLVEADEG